MKLKIISVLSGSLLLAACSSNQDGAGMGEGAAIPGSVQDFNRNVQNKAYFGYDKSTLDSAAENNMLSVAAWTQKYPQPTITVEGHCSEKGTSEYNIGLGQRRAEAAKKFLHAKHAGAQSITTVSYGKSRLPGGPGNDAENQVAIAAIQ
jgi:peptidoglycan-associated lipoprotein